MACQYHALQVKVRKIYNCLVCALLPLNMPLTPSETEEADDLILAMSFDEGPRKEEARAALARWAGKDVERLAYIEGHDKVEASLQSNLIELRNLYSRPSLHNADVRRLTAAKGRSRSRTRSLGLGLGAGAAALVSVISFINPTFSTQSVQTEVGRQLEFEMTDGTRLFLNTDTALEIHNRLRSRDVELKYGEVMFSVVHSDIRPFHVRAAHLDIEDTGTRFAVRSAPQLTTITVAEGTVTVFSEEMKDDARISANEGVKVGSNHVLVPMTNGAVTQSFAWTRRRIEFTMEPLEDLVADIQRYRVGRIVFADAKAKTYPVTGNFSIEDPDRFLRTLADAAPISVHFDSHGTVVISSAVERAHVYQDTRSLNRKP